MKQLILDLAWAPLPPFAAFMPGDNAAVVAQLREQAWPGAPIYLWGPAGSGKTQLLHELQARAQIQGQAAQWFDAGTPVPWTLDDDTALVLLDGADQWDAAQQHAAFTLFVEAASRVGAIPSAAAGSTTGPSTAPLFDTPSLLTAVVTLSTTSPARSADASPATAAPSVGDASSIVDTPSTAALRPSSATLPADARLGVQFAAAGCLPPVDLPLREDLRTRLGWGTVHAVQPLAEGDTRVALQQEARRHGINLGDEVLDYLLTRFARDLKSLMHLLHRLDGFALAEKRAVTIPLLKRMLNEENASA